MKISFKGDYALKIILDLALNFNGSLVQLKSLALRQDIPKKYLEQIVLNLKSARYVKTIRGPKGGIMLAKDPGKITMGEIIRLIDGPTSPITCVSCTNYTKCAFEKKCVLRPVFNDVKERINEIVDNTTFADLAKNYNKSFNKEYSEYSI